MTIFNLVLGLAWLVIFGAVGLWLRAVFRACREVDGPGDFARRMRERSDVRREHE